MKEYSQFQKIFAVLMIFLVSIQLSGCYSSKIISSSVLPLPDSIKCSYIIHCQNSKYLLENTTISNGILCGRIDTVRDYRQLGKKIHVYLLSDTVMKINTEKILTIPLNGIAKVEMTKVDVLVTIILVGVSSLVIFTIVGLVIFSSSGGFKFYGNH